MAMTKTINFTSMFARITKLHVERVMRGQPDEHGRDTVAYHKLIKAEGYDVRDGEAPETIEVTFNVMHNGKEINIADFLRITPATWRDDMFDLCREYGIRADRLGVPALRGGKDGDYIITNPAPLLVAHDAA